MSFADRKDLSLAHTILRSLGWAGGKYEHYGVMLGSKSWPCARAECSESHRVLFEQISRDVQLQFFFCQDKVFIAHYVYDDFPQSFEKELSHVQETPDRPTDISRSRWMAFVTAKTLEFYGMTPRFK